MKPKTVFAASAFCLILVTSIIIPAGPALANACNPGRTAASQYFRTGFQRGAVSPNGVSAKITVDDVYVYPAGGSTSAYVELQGNGDRWARLGWNKKPNGTRQTFWYFRDDINNINDGAHYGNTPVAGAVYEITVSGSTITFKIAGSTVYTRSIAWSASNAWVQTQTLNYASQVPETASEPAKFENARYRNGSTWFALDGTFVQSGTPPLGGVHPGLGLKIDSLTYHTWDSNCLT